MNVLPRIHQSYRDPIGWKHVGSPVPRSVSLVAGMVHRKCASIFLFSFPFAFARFLVFFESSSSRMHHLAVAVTASRPSRVDAWSQELATPLEILDIGFHFSTFPPVWLGCFFYGIYFVIFILVDAILHVFCMVVVLFYTYMLCHHTCIYHVYVF